MKLGLFGISSGTCADPEVAIRVARACEAAGFDSVWAGEHVVLPDPQAPPSPVPPRFPMLDPTVTLAFIAGQTSTLRLGTGIIILPQRNPLVLAKELASLDVVSNGRLIFGLGVGYLKQEFDALGIPFEKRGARSDDYIDAIRAIWTQDAPAHTGPFSHFAGVQARPVPVSRPHPPMVVGGHSPGAYRRAVERGNGWFGFALDFARTQACLTQLEQARRTQHRPAALGDLEISVTPLVELTRDALRRFEDLGVARLVPMLPGNSSADEMVAFVEKAGALL